MRHADLFLPCARGAEDLLADEVRERLTDNDAASREHLVERVQAGRAGVMVLGASVNEAMRLNLWSRLAQRVLWPLASGPYRHEDDLYALAQSVDWSRWIDVEQTLSVQTTAQRSPLTSLNFASLRIKDAVCDVMREQTGARPSVDTRNPHLPLALHLTPTHATLYVDTSGAPLFKRGWRDASGAEAQDDDDGVQTRGVAARRRTVKGEAPLKETLAATMLAASGWDAHHALLDPCCGAGTIAIEAAQVACSVAPGLQRRFAFEGFKAWHDERSAWQALRHEARAAQHAPSASIHASDIDARLVAVAQDNAKRAGVAHAITFARADALRRAPPPTSDGGWIVTNPPFGHRIDAKGSADGDRERFAAGLATQWKQQHGGWQAWVLSPDPDFEAALRLKARRRVPLWNGAIECRLLGFDVVSGSMRRNADARGDFTSSVDADPAA